MAYRPGRSARHLAIAVSSASAVFCRNGRLRRILSLGLVAMALFYGLCRPACEAWGPRLQVRTVDWATKNISLPAGSEIQGKFRPDLFPHMIEPLDCCDDPYYERVSVQAASRMGKTVSAQVLLAKTAACNPHPQAFADADERSTKRVIRRTWKLFDRCEPLAGKLPPPRRRSQDRMELADSVIEGAWSGSPATAADYAAYVVVINEIDKASRNTSEEADFAHLMAERAKGYRGSTVLSISTPSLKDRSRIEALRLQGDNRARCVPCPFCNHFQELTLGEPSQPGGVRWEKDSKGHATPQIAYETAWYECAKCSKKILDEHRYEMMNAGLYVKEGQQIRRGKVVGNAIREGRHASFGPLSTLHSLLTSITWGSYAREFLESSYEAKRSGNKERLRNWVNSWDGRTWDPRKKKIEPHELTERLGTTDPQRLCPAWSVFLTRSIDVGGDANVFHWQVSAWGAHERGHVVDWGVAVGEKELEQVLSAAAYPHADGGISLKVSRTGIDSSDGDHTETVYMLCNRFKHWGCVPLKGLTGKFPQMIRPSPTAGDPKLASKLKAAAGGYASTGSSVLFDVNHERTQGWIQAAINGEVKQHHPNAFTLCQQASQDGAFLAQLLAEWPLDETNEDGYRLHKWQRAGDNEQRDCCRYNRALASLLTNYDANWARQQRISVAVAQRSDQQQPRFTMPDGRDYFVLDRQG
jgi:phage terminase large subunit GpA-like protein